MGHLQTFTGDKTIETGDNAKTGDKATETGDKTTETGDNSKTGDKASRRRTSLLRHIKLLPLQA